MTSPASPHASSTTEPQESSLPASSQDARQQLQQPPAEPPDFAAADLTFPQETDSGWEAATLNPPEGSRLLTDLQGSLETLSIPAEQTQSQPNSLADAHTQQAALAAITEEAQQPAAEAPEQPDQALHVAELAADTLSTSAPAEHLSQTHDTSQYTDTQQQPASQLTALPSAHANPAESQQQPEADDLMPAPSPLVEQEDTSAAEDSAHKADDGLPQEQLDQEESPQPQSQSQAQQQQPEQHEQLHQTTQDASATAENGQTVEERGQAGGESANGPRSFAEAGRAVSKASLAESSASTSERLLGQEASCPLPQENGEPSQAGALCLPVFCMCHVSRVLSRLRPPCCSTEACTP